MQRTTGKAAVALGGRDERESLRWQWRWPQAQWRRRRVAWLDRARSEQRLQCFAGAAGLLVGEYRVTGVWHDEQGGARYLCGDFARIGGRRAQIVGAAEDQRGNVGQGRSVDGGGGSGERPIGARLHVAQLQ